MLFRSLAGVLIPFLLLLGVHCTALPELGHEIKAAAQRGDAEAQMELAGMYYRGDVFEHDMDKSLHWMRAAAEQKLPKALSTLGLFYLNGHGVEKDEAKGFTMVSEAAELGFANAQGYLAFAYGTGSGVAPDEAKFLYWTQRAATGGEARSQLNLALLKLAGRLVEQDVPGAKGLLVRSADQGYTDAQVTLGEYLARGIDGEPDLVEACKWFALAGTKGHKRANALLMAVVPSMTEDQMDEAADRAHAWLEARGEGLR